MKKLQTKRDFRKKNSQNPVLPVLYRRRDVLSSDSREVRERGMICREEIGQKKKKKD